jgi:hypothetical protein
MMIIIRFNRKSRKGKVGIGTKIEMVKNFHRSTRGEIVGIWIEVEVVEI